MEWPGAPVLLEIFLRTTLVYFAVFLLMRITGKRQLGELTPFDLIVLLLLSEGVQNAIIGGDESIPGGLTAVATLLLWNHVVGRITLASPRLAKVLEGEPTVLIDHGRIQFQALRREGISLDDLYETLREHQVTDPRQVAHAVLEVDGQVSVIREDEAEGYQTTVADLRRKAREMPGADMLEA